MPRCAKTSHAGSLPTMASGREACAGVAVSRVRTCSLLRAACSLLASSRAVRREICMFRVCGRSTAQRGTGWCMEGNVQDAWLMQVLMQDWPNNLLSLKLSAHRHSMRGPDNAPPGAAPAVLRCWHPAVLTWLQQSPPTQPACRNSTHRCLTGPAPHMQQCREVKGWWTEQGCASPQQQLQGASIVTWLYRTPARSVWTTAAG